jgi:hypothetical protein
MTSSDQARTVTRGIVAALFALLAGALALTQDCVTPDISGTKAQWKKSALTAEFGGRVVGSPLGDFQVFTDKERRSISADGLTLTLETGDPKGIHVYDKD